MIARSDLFILVVSASLLAAGILRWQNNLSSMTVASQANRNNLTINSTASTGAAVVGNSAVNGAVSGNFGASTSTQSQTSRSVAVANNQNSSSAVNSATTTATVAQNNVQNPVPAATSAEPAIQVNEPLYGTYVVQSGDFLGRIAQTYGTSVATLQQINNIDGSLIEIGQEIKYPLPAN